MKFHIMFCPYSRYDRKVQHYRVLKDNRGWVTVDDEQYFENLFKLVEVNTTDLNLSTHL